MIDDPIPAALRVGKVLDELGLVYWLGGSLASSIHGEPRSTHDVDFVVEMTAADVDALTRALECDYLIDREFVREAVERRSSFQLVDKKDFGRVDFFVAKGRPFDEERRRRRVRHVIDLETGEGIWVASAEDVVLQKLAWYRLGGEVSDLQWRDVLGVLKANPRLDLNHLQRWAGELEVADLLARALEQAGIDPGSHG